MISMGEGPRAVKELSELKQALLEVSFSQLLRLVCEQMSRLLP